MKLLKILFWSAIIIILFVNVALAGDNAERIRETATVEHWVCKDVAELAKKYEVDGKLPEAIVAEGKPCVKSDVVSCFLSVMDKVLKKSEKEGTDAVPREDLDRLARLRDALLSELADVDDYHNRREAIEKMLAKPEKLPFMVKAGIKGFTRGEGAGNFRLAELSSNPGHAEGRFLYRVLPYVYWHPTDSLDIHLEGQGYGYTGGSQYYGK